MQKFTLMIFFLVALTSKSYSQLGGLGNVAKGSAGLLMSQISFTEEDSYMRLNYFLNKEEETLPNKTYSIKIVNSQNFLTACNCEASLTAPITSYLSKNAPNLTKANSDPSDIVIEINLTLNQLITPSIKSKKGSIMSTGGVDRQLYQYWVETSYSAGYTVNVYDLGKKVYDGSDSTEIKVDSDYKDSAKNAEEDWKNHYDTYINKKVSNYNFKSDIESIIINGLKSNIPKPFPRVKALNLARFNKKDKKSHLFGTSDKHINNVQAYIKCEINNIYKKCDVFDKEISTSQLEEARDFWKNELQNKYAGSKKKKNLRNGYAFNLLTTSFLLKDNESFEFAYNYIENNKYVSKSIGLSRKKMIEIYKDLQVKFLK